MSCSQVAALFNPAWTPRATGCEECLAAGSHWVHLRVCLTCGHVGCCDDSEHRHARAHAGATGHVLMTSGEDGEDWAWCFEDETIWDSVEDIVQ